MAEVIPIDDAYGSAIGSYHRLPAIPGAHVAYARGSSLVVEWYDFGPHAPYESANFLIFERPAQLALRDAMGVGAGFSPHMLAYQISMRFDSYWEVRNFAEKYGIEFTREVDFMP